MIVGFLHSEKPRERVLAGAAAAGCRVHGDDAWTAQFPHDPNEAVSRHADVYCMVGVKSRDMFRAARRKRAHAVLFDKGYLRHLAASAPRCWEYWRVSLNAHSPTDYLLTENHPPARFDAWGRDIAPWRTEGGHIVIAGSSEKYHAFCGLSHPTSYARKLVRALQDVSERPIVYRPKPSWKNASPVFGTQYSTPKDRLEDVLSGAWCLVTHGSNAALEAILMGIPAIVLGAGVAAPISSRTLDEVEAPRLADDDELRSWLNNVAHWQWTQSEIASGEMWGEMRLRIIGRQ